MQDGRASQTAERVAMRRAAHQLYDTPPLVFTDPLAMQILPLHAQEEVSRREEVERMQPFARSMRAFVCARSRFAEDALHRAIAAGVRQYVVLGAGLDTYCGRTTAAGLRIFEVDHPATQVWKQACLEQASINVPNTVAFVSVDFEREDMMTQLGHCGFDKNKSTFCSWLGVLQYLSHEAAEATFRALGTLPKGSGVAFDYSIARHALTPAQQDGFDWLAARVAQAGEPFQAGFEPQELNQLLTECGFTRVEDLDGSAIAARYFAGRADGLTMRGGAGRIACAWRG